MLLICQLLLFQATCAGMSAVAHISCHGFCRRSQACSKISGSPDHEGLSKPLTTSVEKIIDTLLFCATEHVASGLNTPDSKVPILDPYLHRGRLHERWIVRASQRLGDLACLKYGSVKEFFRVSSAQPVYPYQRIHRSYEGG